MALSTTLFADPFLSEMDRAMNRFIQSAIHSPLPSSASVTRPGSHATTSSSAMPMDIIETATAYELHADTPGMAADDVKVELHEGVLTVSGERKVSHQSAATAGGKLWRSERSSYSFARAFTLPDNVNADKITASIDKGVLLVTVPKKDPPSKPEPKRITVTSAL